MNRYVYVENNPLKYVDPTGNINEMALETKGYSNADKRATAAGTGIGTAASLVVAGGVYGASTLMVAFKNDPIKTTREVTEAVADFVMGDAIGPSSLSASSALASRLPDMKPMRDGGFTAIESMEKTRQSLLKSGIDVGNIELDRYTSALERGVEMGKSSGGLGNGALGELNELIRPHNWDGMRGVDNMQSAANAYVTYPPASDVPELLDLWRASIKDALSSGVSKSTVARQASDDLIKIHPFTNGNHRTADAVENIILNQD